MDADGIVYGETYAHVLKNIGAEVGHPGGKGAEEYLAYLDAQIPERRKTVEETKKMLEEANILGKKTALFESRLATREEYLNDVEDKRDLIKDGPRQIGHVTARHHGTVEREASSALKEGEVRKSAIVERMMHQNASLHAKETILKMKDLEISRIALTVDTAIFQVGEGVPWDPAILHKDEEVPMVNFRDIGHPAEGVNVRKLGKTTGLTTGTIVGRRYVVMPRNQLVTFEYVVTSLVLNEFSAPGDSGAWVWEEETEKVVGKIMGEFRGECWTKCSVISSMPLCMEKINEEFRGAGPLSLVKEV